VTAWLSAPAMRESLASLEPIWATEVTRLLPELAVERPGLPVAATLREKWQRQRFFEALSRAIVGRRAQLLLHLDDMQWCDRETLEWVHYLLRFDPRARLMVLATVRGEEVGDTDPLAELLLVAQRNGYLTEIGIGPLDEAETSSLASSWCEMGKRVRLRLLLWSPGGADMERSLQVRSGWPRPGRSCADWR
jgi:predicted ATPase